MSPARALPAAAVVLGLVACASMMAGSNRRGGETELLSHPAKGKVDADVFNARQGAQDALVRAGRNAMQASLMKEALGGGHPWRHMKDEALAAAVKEAHETAVHHSAAWEAGHKALAQRNPWAGVDSAYLERKVAVRKQPAAAAKQALASVDEEGMVHRGEERGAAHNPKALVHASDRVVDAGEEVAAPEAHGKWLAEGEEGASDAPEESTKWDAHARRQQLALHPASAAGLGGAPRGVPVEGGHVVYMPLGSLAAQGGDAPPRPARRPEARAAQRRHRPAAAGRQQAVEFPASYGKIVEYGRRGQRLATIYGPGYEGSGRAALLPPRVARRTQSLGSAPPMSDELTDESERKIEQDIVFRLLHNFGPADKEQSSLRPKEEEDYPGKGEEEEQAPWWTFGLAQQSAAARGGPSAALSALAAVVAVVGSMLLAA
eukprot:CAMPEP_0173441134 /NCGR_PEP_ID=MMETSP1357-20121228/23788_1 /TAXON_ID=77926 /ORGANISM="Hemiselmis rufescens, Strain PCC563" /LENGTH=432 /DNA_ID=CAMNT_0014406689 /DNA_START=31 /DNA_END=1329 /DNA_ORIENTATION=-